MALIESTAIYKLFFNLDMPEWTVYVRYVFEMLPSFHFIKLYGDVTHITCYHLEFSNLIYVPPLEWKFEFLFRELFGSFMTKDRYFVPSMYTTLKKVMQVTLIYFIAAMYFDNVLSHNRGTAKPFYFFLMPSYWFKSCQKKLP
jgi:hypothetical protein